MTTTKTTMPATDDHRRAGCAPSVPAAADDVAGYALDAQAFNAFSTLQGAFSTVLKAVGGGLATTARKG
jgi:hypothetical protein